MHSACWLGLPWGLPKLPRPQSGGAISWVLGGGSLTHAWVEGWPLSICTFSPILIPVTAYQVLLTIFPYFRWKTEAQRGRLDQLLPSCAVEKDLNSGCWGRTCCLAWLCFLFVLLSFRSPDSFCQAPQLLEQLLQWTDCSGSYDRMLRKLIQLV